MQQVALLFVVIVRGQVGFADLIIRYGGQDALLAVLVGHGAHHVLLGDDLVEGGSEALQVDIIAIELEIEVGGDVTQVKMGLASDPVGVLHVVQGERLVAVGRVRFDARQFGRTLALPGLSQQRNQLFLVLAYLLLQFGVEDAGRRVHPQFSVLDVDLDVQRRQGLQQTLHVLILVTPHCSNTRQRVALPQAPSATPSGPE